MLFEKNLGHYQARRIIASGISKKQNDNHSHNENDNRSHSKSQPVIPTKLKDFTNLIGNVRDRRLIKSLEILEQSGIEGDLALLIMGEILPVGVCDE